MDTSQDVSMRRVQCQCQVPPSNPPEVFTEIEDLLDRCFLERKILLERDKELAATG